MAAGWLLNFTPGPDVLCIVSHSLRSGARAGIVAGLGVTAGCFVHIFAAALGVGEFAISSLYEPLAAPFGRSSFDAIVCVEVIEHLYEWPSVIRFASDAA